MSPELPIFEILAFKYAGPLTSSGAFVMWLKDWDKTVKRYYYFWGIRSSYELILVDAGVPPRLARAKNLPGYKNPIDLLSKLGIRPEDVKKIILTHIHWDHSSGIELFPEASIFLQEKEFNFWLKDPVAQRPPFAHVSDQVSNAFLRNLEGTDKLVLLKGDWEIVPGVKVIKAPGHTPAAQAVAVNTGNGIAVLGSDCAHVKRNYQEDWPSCLIVDLVGWMKTYDRLRDIASSPELLFPGHDRAMLEDYPEVAKDITRLA